MTLNQLDFLDLIAYQFVLGFTQTECVFASIQQTTCCEVEQETDVMH